jgi:transposase
LDESYFGGSRKGKRGRGAAGKTVVFGILKRGSKVFTKVVDDTKTTTLMPVIVRKIAPDSVVYTDCYRS